MRKLSLRKSLFVTLALSVAIPLIALAAATWVQVSEVREQTALRLEESAVTIAAALENETARAQAALETAAVALSPSLRVDEGDEGEGLPGAAASLLHVASGPDALTALLGENGRPLERSAGVREEDAADFAREVAGEWVFRQTLRTKRTTTAHVIRDDGASFFVICVPVTGGRTADAVGAVLVSGIPADRLLMNVTQGFLEPGTAVSVTDRRGRPVARTGPGTDPETDAGAAGASAEMTGPDWTVSVSLPGAALFSRADMLAVIGLLTGALVSILCFCAARLHFRHLQAFFDELTEQIARLRDGAPATDTARPLAGVPEAEMILGKFRDMALSLAKSREEITRINAGLEERVRLRTEELAHRNAELSAANALLVPIDRGNGRNGRTGGDGWQHAFGLMCALLGLERLEITEKPLKNKDGGENAGNAEDGAHALSLPLARGGWLTAVSSEPLPADAAETLARFLPFLNVMRENEALFRETRRQHAGLSAVFFAMTEGFALVAPGQGVLFVNDRFNDFLGSHARSLTAEKLFGPGADPALMPAAVRDAIASPGQNVAWVPAENQEQSLTVRAFPVELPGTGGLLGTALIVRDVTREEEVNRLKDDVVALASHELNNPVASLRLGLETLATRGDRLSDAMRATLCSTLLAQAERLQMLITDWLDISMLNNGVLAYHRRDTDLTAVLAEACSSWSTEHPEVLLEAPDNAAPFPMTADPERLRQVFINLLENARRYNDKPRAEIRVTAEVTDRCATIDFADNGIGIDPEEAPHLFERFWRGERAKRRSPNGSGLGLAICRTIIEGHGGRLEVAAGEPGRGTTMRITLPRG